MPADRHLSNVGESGVTQNTTSVYDLSGTAKGATYQTFGDSPAADAEDIWVRLNSEDSDKYEVGLFTFNTGTPNTLTRVSTVESSNADGAVDFGTESIEAIASVIPGQKDVSTDLASFEETVEVTAAPAINLSGSGAIQDAGSDAITFDGSGNITVPNQSTFNADMTLGVASSDYVLKQGFLNNLAFEYQGSGNAVEVSSHTADADGTDIVRWSAWAVGAPGATDRERGVFGWDGSSIFEVKAIANGTGSVRPLHVFTGSNTNQFIARTDGNVAMTNSLKVGGTGAASGGALEVAGDININPTNTYSPTNDTTDRTFDANSTSTSELADVLATLIRDLGMDA